MKLGTLIEDPCVIIFRLGPNSKTPPGGRHLEFQYGRHIVHTFAYNFETKTDRNVKCMGRGIQHRCYFEHLMSVMASG